MNIAAVRNFGLWRGATSGHIRSDLDARSDNANFISAEVGRTGLC